MDAGLEDWRENPGRAALNLARASIGAVVDVIGAVLFSVMQLLNPFVMGLLSVAVFGLLFLCAGFWLINLAHPMHFPFFVVFWMVAGCGVVAILWQLFLYWLPRSRGPIYAIVGIATLYAGVSLARGAAHRQDLHGGSVFWMVTALGAVAVLVLSRLLRARRPR